MNPERKFHPRYFHVGYNGKFTPLESIQDALATLNGAGYVWFDFLDPAREDLEPLMNPLSLHHLAIEDCLDEEQVPKVDDFPTNTFILFNCYDYIDNTLVIDEVNFFLGKNFLVSVHHCLTGTKDFFNKLDDAITRDINDVRKGPDYLLHVILDYIVDRKFKSIEAIQEELDNAEEIILKSPATFTPETVLRLRKSLLSLRKSLFHEREVMVRLCRRDSPFVTEKAIYHFRDVYDHLAKFFEAIEMYREMISTLMEMYLSMLNNRMAKVGNRTNKVVRRLTLINTIFLPLTLLAGIGGMSEWTQIFGLENWKFAYNLLLLIMVVVAVANYFILKLLESKDSRNADNELQE
ncbi:MAG: magnesium transporter CorA family protein [Acidobacteria bacterium]|jgi:magnesium transporter|nr:magnesium transporter CorA family protein [Acidobacteriota bacterium]